MAGGIALLIHNLGTT